MVDSYLVAVVASTSKPKGTISQPPVANKQWLLPKEAVTHPHTTLDSTCVPLSLGSPQQLSDPTPN